MVDRAHNELEEYKQANQSWLSCKPKICVHFGPIHELTKQEEGNKSVNLRNGQHLEYVIHLPVAKFMT
jgi:hypothetical protein